MSRAGNEGFPHWVLVKGEDLKYIYAYGTEVGRKMTYVLGIFTYVFNLESCIFFLESKIFIIHKYKC